MRDLHVKNQKPPARNRNRVKRERKPINYRGFFKKVVRLASWVTVASIIAVAGYQIYGVVARTTFLRLERIELNSLKRLTRDEVITQAGVKIGDGMLSLRLKRIGEQLAKNPWVEKVRVRRYLPGTLVVEIVEREPVAIANMGYLYYLDKNGDVFKPLTVGDGLDYPVITGITEEDMGKDPAGAKGAFQSALSLVAQLRSNTLLKLEDISEIHYDKGFGFTLFAMEKGVPVRLGSNGFPEKLARLNRIFGDLKAQLPTLEYIDLDYNDKIIVKKT